MAPSHEESHLWLPPRRLRRYAWNKVVAGLVVSLIFAGWLVLQWTNPAMRWLAGGLLVMTAWVVVASIVSDHRRGRGRQVAIEAADPLVVAEPQAPLGGETRGEKSGVLAEGTLPGVPVEGVLRVTRPGDSRRVELSSVAYAAWQDGDASQVGLWLYDQDHQVLAHLDEGLLADEGEARAFLGWIRQRVRLPFEVRWPSRA